VYKAIILCTERIGHFRIFGVLCHCCTSISIFAIFSVALAESNASPPLKFPYIHPEISVKPNRIANCTVITATAIYRAASLAVKRLSVIYGFCQGTSRASRPGGSALKQF
jgi:hypothetical protein